MALSRTLELVGKDCTQVMDGETRAKAGTRVKAGAKPPRIHRIRPRLLQEELPGSETMDLTPYLREDILLALPDYPHCDWSGERVCPGRQEARGETAASGEEAGGPAHAPSAWEVLDQIHKPAK